MQLGIVGLGRMGAGLTRRLLRAGHDVVGHDLEPDHLAALAETEMTPAANLEDLVGAMTAPRAIWVMVPAGATEAVIGSLADLVDPGDVIIDGGNSHYHHDIERRSRLAERGIEYLDIGTSGGVFGEQRGYCLMAGGDRAAFDRLTPLFEAIAPGVESVPRTPGLDGPPGTAEKGYLYCGPAGAGHFVKMIHNGIEYGAMAALAEGLNILDRADVGLRESAADSAEVTPLENPERYRYEFDIDQVAEVWRRGSVVSSWLLDLAAIELSGDPSLRSYAGRVSDSGEGRWALAAAIDEGIPAPVLASALFSRFSSRGEAKYSDQVLSAVRHAMGGHVELDD